MPRTQPEDRTLWTPKTYRSEGEANQARNQILIEGALDLVGAVVKSQGHADSPKKVETPVPHLSETIAILRQAYKEMAENYAKIENGLDNTAKANLKAYREVLDAFIHNLTVLECRIRKHRTSRGDLENLLNCPDHDVDNQFVSDLSLNNLNIVLKKACNTTTLYDFKKTLGKLWPSISAAFGIVTFLSLGVALVPPAFIFLMIFAAGKLLLMSPLMITVVLTALLITLVTGALWLAAWGLYALINYQISCTNPLQLNKEALLEFAKQVVNIDLVLNHAQPESIVSDTENISKAPSKNASPVSSYRPFFESAAAPETNQKAPQFFLTEKDAQTLSAQLKIG